MLPTSIASLESNLCVAVCAAFAVKHCKHYNPLTQVPWPPRSSPLLPNQEQSVNSSAGGGCWISHFEKHLLQAVQQASFHFPSKYFFELCPDHDSRQHL